MTLRIDESAALTARCAGAAVVRLLCGSCPPDVARLVIPVVVDAVKRVAVRTWSDIADESGEVVPARAYPDPASTVVREVGRVGIPAALAHRSPRRVQRMLPAIAGAAMRRQALARYLACETTAATRVATRQSTCADGNEAAGATALAEPYGRVALAATGVDQRCQPAERLTGEIAVFGAAARTRVAVRQMRCRYDCRVAAVAITEPEDGSFAASSLLADAQATEPLAGQILEWGHIGSAR